MKISPSLVQPLASATMDGMKYNASIRKESLISLLLRLSVGTGLSVEASLSDS